MSEFSIDIHENPCNESDKVIHNKECEVGKPPLIFLTAIFAFTFVATPFTYAEEKSEEILLKEAVALSKEVKEFEKTLGIEPTEALSESTTEQPNNSRVWIWQQKMRTLALDRHIDITTELSFSMSAEAIPLKSAAVSLTDYALYFRKGNEFAGSESVITVTLAQEPPWWMVQAIVHEDLHGNIETPHGDNEVIVAALGYLAALEFFKSKMDTENVKEITKWIQSARTISKELNAFVQEVEKEIKTNPEEVRWQYIERLTERMKLFPAYEHIFNQLEGQSPFFTFEAKISHDFMYYKHIDRIIALYEKIGSFNMLFHELKNAPEDTREFPNYLKTLEKKHESPAR